MASSHFIFNESCIKNALINMGELSEWEFSTERCFTGEFTIEESDKGEFSVGDFFYY